MYNILNMLQKLLFIGWCLFANSTLSNAQDVTEEMLSDMDIPLMSGLFENPDERMVFDSLEGNIINAQAQGKVMAVQAYEYYRIVLPSLSWKIVEDKESNMKCEDEALYCLRAYREQENLIVLFKTKNQTTIVNYAISPM
jgi:hypothetical protein